MIPKTAIVIFAALLVAIEAKSSREAIGERLKGFHDHFTSQAKEITDAGQKTDNIVKSLSTQLASLLNDAVEVIEDMEGKTKGLEKTIADQKTVIGNQQTQIGDLQAANAKCKKDYEELAKICHKELTDCKSKIEYMAAKLQQCDNARNKCELDLQKCLVRPAPGCEAEKAEIKRLNKLNDKLNVELEVCKGGKGWEKVNGRFVKHFNDQKVTWSEAKASCEEHNAKLLMVKDDVTQEWTKKIHTPVWIGATDQGHEGDWKWVDGSPVDKTKKSKHWGAGEPDSGLGLVEEDCLATGFELLWIHHGQWADEVCNSKFTFACELPKE